ncbi:MAG: Fic family protein [Prevotellaceae bacterium]|jgi:prophage maintenance system killer protein|nr:Fic family protein [Prevotellaceae bacterium]
METQELILNYLKDKSNSSSKEIFEGLNSAVSYATVKRSLSKLLSEKHITQQGNAKNSRYTLSPTFNLFYPINLDEYYSKEIDEREILRGYNFSLIPETLQSVSLFTSQELILLSSLQSKFSENIAQLSAFEYHKDMERLAIDLSWKSSQIEGNTYSLLETERLLKDKQTAEGKTKDEAIMLLNHKDAIDFVVANPDYFLSLSIAKVEELHSILIKELGVDRNIRTRRVGITGTNYRPLENEFQIREALQQTCDLINNRENIFEKALFALVLLSYLQAFTDGNKRVARITANALLVANKYCPISFRTVDSIDYKKAMLLFYEQNNISAFKQIFVNQFKFAVENYF